jgi:rod shape-determining protein MreD
VSALKFLAGLVAATLLHYGGTRVWGSFPLAVDLFLIVTLLEARHGSPLAGMLAGCAAGAVADGLAGGPWGLFGFADTVVGFGVARAAQQLVVQRTTSFAAIFAAGAAAQQAILAGLSLIFRPGQELAEPAWLGIKVATTVLLGLAWTRGAERLTARLLDRRGRREKKMELPR